MSSTETGHLQGEETTLVSWIVMLKVAIARAPVTMWEDTERYLGHPSTNPIVSDQHL